MFHTISPLECFLAGCELYHALLDTNLFAVSIFCSSSDVQALILTCLLRTIFNLDPTFQSVYLKYTLCFFFTLCFQQFHSTDPGILVMQTRNANSLNNSYSNRNSNSNSNR